MVFYKLKDNRKFVAQLKVNSVRIRVSTIDLLVLFKMEPLKTNRQVLTWLSVFPPEKDTSNWQRRRYSIVTVLVLLLNLAGFTATSTFIVKNASVDLATALFGMIQLPITANTAYGIVTAILLRHQITTFIKNLSNIYKTCKAPPHLDRKKCKSKNN